MSGMPRPLGAVCEQGLHQHVLITWHETHRTDVTATLWTNGHRTRPVVRYGGE
jgi:hypothetical protein